MTRIAFLGLGRMGLPMALNLARGGHQVRAFDIDARTREAAAAEGLDVADSIAEAVNGAEAAISMVPTGRHVIELFTGEGGVLSLLAPGALVIDSSTIEVANARKLHAAGRERGIEVLDAPVSGGVMGAQAGTLTFMVGGEEATLEKARPILSAMGRNIFHAGEAGSGQAAKICNNLLAGISMIAVSEAFTLGERLGLAPEKLQQIVAVSTGGCFSLTNYPPVPGLVPNVPSSRGYVNGFASQLMLKDLRLAEGAALETGSSLPLGGLASALYSVFCQSGRGDLDYSAVIKLIAGEAPPAAKA